MGRDRLGGGDPAAAAGDDQPQLPFDRRRPRRAGPDLALQGAAVEAQLDRGGGALQPVEVVDQRERLAPVEADHLEGAVAAVEAVVLEADRRLGRRRDLAVDAGQLFEALAHAAEATCCRRGR